MYFFILFFFISASSKRVFKQLRDYLCFAAFNKTFLIHVCILNANLYLADDSVCNDALSCRNIQVRRIIRVIIGSSIRTPFRAIQVRILHWRAEIKTFNPKLVKYPFKFKYRANTCPRNFSKFNSICCMFYYFWYMRMTFSLIQVPEKIIPLTIFLCVIGILTVVHYRVF